MSTNEPTLDEQIAYQRARVEIESCDPNGYALNKLEAILASLEELQRIREQPHTLVYDELQMPYIVHKVAP